MYSTPEGCLAKLMAQHMQHPRAFLVQVRVEQLKAIVMVDMVDNGTAVMAIFLQVVLLESEHGLLEVVGALVMLTPQFLEVGGKAFVQPAIGPVTAGKQVAVPLVCQFVRYHRHYIHV